MNEYMPYLLTLAHPPSASGAYAACAPGSSPRRPSCHRHQMRPGERRRRPRAPRPATLSSLRHRRGGVRHPPRRRGGRRLRPRRRETPAAGGGRTLRHITLPRRPGAPLPTPRPLRRGARPAGAAALPAHHAGDQEEQEAESEEQAQAAPAPVDDVAGRVPDFRAHVPALEVAGAPSAPAVLAPLRLAGFQNAGRVLGGVRVEADPVLVQDLRPGVLQGKPAVPVIVLRVVRNVQLELEPGLGLRRDAAKPRRRGLYSCRAVGDRYQVVRSDVLRTRTSRYPRSLPAWNPPQVDP